MLHVRQDAIITPSRMKSEFGRLSPLPPSVNSVYTHAFKSFCFEITSQWPNAQKNNLDPVEYLLFMPVVSAITRPPRRRASLNLSATYLFWYTFEAALVGREGTRHRKATFVMRCVGWRLDTAELDLVQAFFVIELP